MKQTIQAVPAHRLSVGLTLALQVASGATVFAWIMPAGDFRSDFLNALVIAAPVAAFVSCLGAARSVPRALAWPWYTLAAAAGIAAFGQMHWHEATDPLAGYHALIEVVAIAFVALGLGGILHQRDHDRVSEIALDVALILTTAAVVTLRWSPAAHAILLGNGHWPLAERIAAFTAPIAAGCALLFGIILMIARTATPGGLVAAAISAATAGFGLASIPLAIGLGPCCATSEPAAIAFILACFALAFAGIHVNDFASPTGKVIRGIGGIRLRLVVAPVVALVMGIVIVDSAWSGPLHAVTAVLLAILGLLLALRASQLLNATRTQSAERIELAQSRAMIEVSQALASTTRLDETLDLIVHHAVRLLRGRASTIELLTPDGLHLEFYAVNGLPADVLNERKPIDGNLAGWVILHGRARSINDARTDPYVTNDLPGFERSPIAAAPLRYRDATLGALTCVGQYPFDDADLELLTALADQAAVAIENARLFQHAHQMSLTDPLTGLPNRRQLERDLAREFAAAQRGRPLVAIMFDLNEFKEYNDRCGHVAGDEALRLFAAALAGQTRAMNMAARYGGDEFIALLADSDALGAETFIGRVRAQFPGAVPDDAPCKLDFSAGYAIYDPSMSTPEELVAAADRALYQAKFGRQQP